VRHDADPAAFAPGRTVHVDGTDYEVWSAGPRPGTVWAAPAGDTTSMVVLATAPARRLQETAAEAMVRMRAADAARERTYRTGLLVDPDLPLQQAWTLVAHVDPACPAAAEQTPVGELPRVVPNPWGEFSRQEFAAAVLHARTTRELWCRCVLAAGAAAGGKDDERP